MRDRMTGLATPAVAIRRRAVMTIFASLVIGSTCTKQIAKSRRLANMMSVCMIASPLFNKLKPAISPVIFLNRFS